MNLIRNLIAASSLLFVVMGPSVAQAAPTAAQQRAPLSSSLLALGTGAETRPAPEAAGRQEDAKLAQREQAAPALRNFQGGRVYLYLGGGATLVLLLILLLILL